jgi:hypothetical protein
MGYQALLSRRQALHQRLAEALLCPGAGQVPHPGAIGFGQDASAVGLGQAAGGVGLAGVEARDQCCH